MKTLTPSPAVASRPPYSVRKASGTIALNLAGNEGKPPPRELLQHLATAPTTIASQYPNTASLQQTLADMFHLSASQVIVTAGADDALFRALGAVLSPGRELLLAVPTFEMISRYAELFSADIVEIPWVGAPYPSSEIISRKSDRTAAVCVVSPNNPTGLTIQRDAFLKIADSFPSSLVILDHAYVEFADVDLTQEALTRPNVVVVRTLSKAWGLAGLRVGYALGNENIIGWMRTVGHPFPTSGLSLQLAEEKLRTGSNDVSEYVATVRSERSKLIEVLKELGACPVASEANFVFATFKDAEKTFQALAHEGIAVRYLGSLGHYREALRITCPGNNSDFAKLEAGLRAVLEKG